MKRRFLVTGALGRLGSAFMERLGEAAAGFDLPDTDISDPSSIEDAVSRWDPEYIVNCAAVTDVDLCQRDPELAFAVHCEGVRNLASTGRKLITFSTDHVFGGDSRRRLPYLEEDQPSPVNIYAESKLRGEHEALKASSRNVVIRTSWLWNGGAGLVPFLWKSLKAEGYVKAVSNQTSCTTYVPDLVEAVLGIVESGSSGIFHLVNGRGVTPAAVARRFADDIGGEVCEIQWEQLDLDAPRPLYSVMGTRRGFPLPDIRDAIRRWRMTLE